MKPTFTHIHTVYRAVFEFRGRRTYGVNYICMLENAGPPVPGYLGVEECCASIGPKTNQHSLVTVMFHPYEVQS